MTTELPRFPVPRRRALAGIALLALWAALAVGFVGATTRAPPEAAVVSTRPCGEAERAEVRRLEAARSLVLRRDLVEQERGRAFAEHRGWMTPGLRSTPPVPSGAAAARVHALDATIEALGARHEVRAHDDGFQAFSAGSASP